MRDINLESTIYPRFTTRAFATGVPTTLAGTPVLSVYEENNLTQITAGVSITADYDSVTGLNQATIVATAANGYEAGKSYDLVITTGTVGGVSVVGETVFSFTAGYASAQLVDDIWDEILTGATHNIATSAGRRLRGLQEFQGYENGSIWIDTVNGTAGTIDYENGTVENAVNTLADAVTLNASLGFNRFTIFNGSTITLVSTFNNYLFEGDNWTLVLGGQNTGGTHFHGAIASGICTGTETSFIDCHMGACTIDLMHLENCSLAGTLTAGAIGDHHLSQCHSAIAGTSTPIFDVGSVLGSSNVNFRSYSGGIEFQNLGQAGTDTVSVEGDGQVILNSNCIGGSINIRGNFELTDNSVTTTINDDARYDAPRHVDLTWDEVLTGGTHNVTDSSGKRIRDLQEWGSYEGGAIFIDTVNGTAGTTDYESGTILNPVDTIADANTLAASLNLSRFEAAPGSNITFAASQDTQDWKGNVWTLALGGQSISDTHIFGAVVSGICTGANTPEFHECIVGNVTVPPCIFKGSDMGGVVTLPVGTVHIHQCAGDSGFTLDYGVAVANTTVHLSSFSGDLVIDNLGQSGTDILDIRGHGKVTFNASCIGGTVNWDGHFTIVDNGSGITFNSDDISTNVAALPALIDDLAIKKNTAGLLHIEMVLTSDHVTPATGLTVTAQRLIDSGVYASVAGSITEISNGTYRFDYLAADSNGDIITWKFSAGTADDTKLTFKTVA